MSKFGKDRRELARGLKGPWIESPCHVASDPPIRWTPVVTIAEFQDPWPDGTRKLVSPLNLGLSDRGIWVRVWQRGDLQVALDYSPTQHCCFLWPLLEGRPQEVLSTLERGLRDVGQPAGWVKLFPLNNLLASALESQSEGWFRDACRWLESIPCTFRVRRALERVRLEGQSEFLRTSAEKMLKTLENPGRSRRRIPEVGRQAQEKLL
jgi:hypothetical protein